MLDTAAYTCYYSCVKIRYRFRFYPTVGQAKTLSHVFGCCRFVYNWALRFRIDSYYKGKPISYVGSSAALTKLKKSEGHAWLNEVSSVPTQQALRHLQTAFRNFFEKKAGYPSFKKKWGRQSADYTRSAFKWDAENRNLSVAQLGHLKIRWSRTFVSQPSTVTIIKDCAERYFVSLVLDEDIEYLPKTGNNTGVDLGVSRLATLSTGERISNPQYLRRQEKKLAKAQRVLARRKVGSNRRQQQKIRVAKIHAKIADARLDYMHKITTDLVRRFDVIAIEDLNIRGMIKNHCLARSLSDASLGLFRRLITYKCVWYGKELRQVDRFFPSSKKCHVCGHIVENLPLSVREWNCPKCNTHHDRDENAAKNILAAGHVVTARGGCVRRTGGKPAERSARRTANHSAEYCSSEIRRP